MQIKTTLGKMQPPVGPVSQAEAYLIPGTLKALPIELAHIRQLGKLPSNHGDPFDRMLVAEAMHEGLVLVTADRALSAYPVEVLRG